MEPANANQALAPVLALLDAGQPVRAEALCRAILETAPERSDALNLLAVILCRSGRFVEAAGLLQRVLRHDPRNLQALLIFSDIFSVECNTGAEITTLAYARTLAPLDAGVLLRLGLALTLAGRSDEAERAFGALTTIEPAASAAWCYRAHALRGLRRLPGARAAAVRAHRLDPASHEAFAEIGLIALDDGRERDAAAAFRAAAAAEPGFADAYANLGLVLREALAYPDSERALRRAVRLEPLLAHGYALLGDTLQAGGAVAEAERRQKQAIVLNPGSAEAHANLGRLRREQGQLDAAAVAARRGALADPGHDGAAFMDALSLLADGRFEDGFRQYERRRAPGVLTRTVRSFDRPEWGGEDPVGRTILLHAEQGLGDMIQFVRFAAELARAGLRLVVEVHPPLIALFRESLPAIRFVPYGDSPGDYDLQLPLMSLPRVLGTTLATIPGTVPYLRADAARVAAWRARFAGTPGPRVGIVWSGNPRHKADRPRTLPLAVVLDALAPAGAALFAVQKDIRPEDAAVLAARGGEIADLSGRLDDFADTAAAVEALDLVVSVDTSVAHLAGALGRPVWTLLAAAVDWRWLRDRPDTPWYPTMRLYRQERAGEWGSVLARVGDDLAALVSRAARPDR